MPTPASMQDIRRENLRLLVLEKFDGNRAALARAADTNPNQVNLMLTDNEAIRRPCGETLARKIEENLGLPTNWMDTPRTELVGDTPVTIESRPIHDSLRDVLSTCKVPSYVITNEWMREQRLNITANENLFVAMLQADCMEPEISRGCRVIIDGGVKAVSDNGVYILARGDTYFVRRVRRQPSGKWALSGPSPMVVDEVIESFKGIKTHGRILAQAPLPTAVL